MMCFHPPYLFPLLFLVVGPVYTVLSNAELAPLGPPVPSPLLSLQTVAFCSVSLLFFYLFFFLSLRYNQSFLSRKLSRFDFLLWEVVDVTRISVVGKSVWFCLGGGFCRVTLGRAAQSGACESIWEWLLGPGALEGMFFCKYAGERKEEVLRIPLGRRHLSEGAPREWDSDGGWQQVIPPLRSSPVGRASGSKSRRRRKTSPGSDLSVSEASAGKENPPTAGFRESLHHPGPC